MVWGPSWFWWGKLLPIGTCPAFEDGMIDTVNARDLWKALGVGCEYSSWIIRRIEECNFKENEDFVVYIKSDGNPLGGRPLKVRFISLDMAKHLAMLEKNHQGKKVRTYFIEHEKQSRAIMPPSLQAQVAAAKHCKGGRVSLLPSAGGPQHMTLIPEADVYRLIMRSKLPSAQKFEEWVVGTVLPALRKDGMYVMGEEKVRTGEMSHHLPRKPAGYEVIIARQ